MALGLIVEAVTGESYERYCGDTVLVPRKIKKPRLMRSVRIFSSYGGWELSAEDYAKFLTYFYPNTKLLGTTVPKLPDFPLGGGAWYSIGTLVRDAAVARKYNFWHAGAITWGNPQISAGSFFALWNQQIGFVANFSPVLANQAYTDLDVSMYGAAFQ